MTSCQASTNGLVAMIRPAGFWRRFLALTIDCIVFGGAVALLGLLLFATSGGAIRVSGVPVLSHSVCASADVSRHALRLPADFNITEAVACASATFGTVHDLWLDIRDRRETGSTTLTHSIRLPLDPDGALAAPYYLDHAGFLGLLVCLLLSEWLFGASLGKRIMGVWVQPLHGDRLSFAAACRRLLRFGPFAPVVVLSTLTGRSSMSSTHDALMLALNVLPAVLLILVVVNFVLALLRDDLPWHDRWAGTDVVTAR